MDIRVWPRSALMHIVESVPFVVHRAVVAAAHDHVTPTQTASHASKFESEHIGRTFGGVTKRE